jgi:hypothetical protein
MLIIYIDVINPLVRWLTLSIKKSLQNKFKDFRIIKKLAHTFTYTTDLDYATLGTKSTAVRETTVAPWLYKLGHVCVT